MTLTVLEREIVEMIAEGRTSKQIGAEFGIGAKAVNNHVAIIARKLELDPQRERRTLLTRYALGAA